ncbi:hypothetical protein ACUNV4_26255 [Granulosicoccus sp. 3-233]|uniref:hypothetical protein n=1 Tax=Granulosicoccus sp. 3-233 TaxID=3417969 RepID=UPI003D3310A3
MKAFRRTSLTVAITSVLAISACSTSGETSVPFNVSTEAALDGTVSQSPVAEEATLQGSGILKLDADYPSMLEALAGYRLETQAEEMMLLGDSVALSAIGSTELETATFDVLDRDETLTPDLVRTAYSCELGGEMVIESGALLLDEESYTHRVSMDSYHFDQCRVAIDGEQLFNGSLSVLDDYTSGRHFTVRSGRVVWQGFEWQRGHGVNISGNAMIETYNFNSFDSQQYRKASIQDYSMSRGSEIVEQVSDGVFTQTAESSANGGINDYVMSASGSVVNASGIAVHIKTDPAISSHIAAASLDIESAFDGQVLLTADDGSELSLVANQLADSRALLVDVDYRNAAGVLRSQVGERFAELGFVAP